MITRQKEESIISGNLYLIGFMGTGKSTISSWLHRNYGMRVVEMDEVIEKRENQRITEIFATKGEPYFRELETKLLQELSGETNLVVSCGGGTPLRSCNVEEMKKGGLVVLLTAEPETILKRVKHNHDRPLLENRKTVADIAELLEQRREKYEAAADLVLATDGKSAKEICLELKEKMALWNSRKS